MSNIVQYKKHYEIIIKGLDSHIKVSGDSGKKIIEDLLEKSSGFIQINGILYNRFNIDKIEPFEEKLSEAHIQALQRQKEIEEKKKELGIL